MTVTAGSPIDILCELEQLGRAPATDVNHLQNAPAFLRLAALYQTRYSQIRSGSMLRFSLASALRQLGLACLVGGGSTGLSASAAEIFEGLDKAIQSTESRRLTSVLSIWHRPSLLSPSVLTRCGAFLPPSWSSFSTLSVFTAQTRTGPSIVNVFPSSTGSSSASRFRTTTWVRRAEDSLGYSWTLVRILDGLNHIAQASRPRLKLRFSVFSRSRGSE